MTVAAELVPHQGGPLPTTAAALPAHDQVERDLAEWLVEYRSANTRLTYANAVGAPWNPITGERRDTSGLLNGLAWLPLCQRAGLHPYEATRRDVLAWLDRLATVPQAVGPNSGQPLGKASRANALSALQSWYEWLTEHDRIDCSPVVVNRGRLQLRVPARSYTRSLDEHEFLAMLRAADAYTPRDQRARAQALIAFLGTTGCRVSELCSLDTADFGIDQGRRVAALTTKGDKPHRVYVDDWVWERLTAYWAERGSALPARADQVGGRTPAFTTRTGGRITRTQVNRVLRRLAELAGIEDPARVHAHVLRHTLVSLADALGVPITQVQAQLNHSNIATTARYGARPRNYDASPARVLGARLAGQHPPS